MVIQIIHHPGYLQNNKDTKNILKGRSWFTLATKQLPDLKVAQYNIAPIFCAGKGNIPLVLVVVAFSRFSTHTLPKV